MKLVRSRQSSWVARNQCLRSAIHRTGYLVKDQQLRAGDKRLRGGDQLRVVRRLGATSGVGLVSYGERRSHPLDLVGADGGQVGEQAGETVHTDVATSPDNN